MPEFTPGPWKAKSNCPEKKCTWMVFNKEWSNWPIAAGIEENDAHLISAAPDMHEALKMAMPFMEFAKGRAVGPADIDSEELLRQIKQALAKAEGKEA